MHKIHPRAYRITALTACASTQRIVAATLTCITCSILRATSGTGFSPAYKFKEELTKSKLLLATTLDFGSTASFFDLLRYWHLLYCLFRINVAVMFKSGFEFEEHLLGSHFSQSRVDDFNATNFEQALLASSSTSVFRMVALMFDYPWSHE